METIKFTTVPQATANSRGLIKCENHNNEIDFMQLS